MSPSRSSPAAATSTPACKSPNSGIKWYVLIPMAVPPATTIETIVVADRDEEERKEISDDPVAVIRKEFCAHSGMELILSKVEAWSWGNYTVTDGEGNFVIKIEGKLSLRWTRTLLDSTGSRILKIHKKFMNPSILDAFVDGDDGARRVFTVQSSPGPSSASFSLAVFLPFGGSSETDLGRDPEFKLAGAFFENDYGIYRGERLIAKASRKPDASSFVLGCGAYTVKVFPGIDHVFVIALVLIMDELHLEARVSSDSP